MKIEHCKFALHFHRSSISSLRCVSSRFEAAKVNPFALVTDPSLESMVLFMPIHSDVAALVSGNSFLIAIILRAARGAKVVPAVVKRVVIAMIYHLFALYDFTMHQDFGIVLAASSRNESLGVLLPKCIPVPLTQASEIITIDGSILTLRERNKLVGLVARLTSLVSFHVAFHLSSFKGLLLPAASYHKANPI